MVLHHITEVAKDIARPIALLLSILSLYAVFHAAFLTPTSLDDRIHPALLRLALAAAISTVGASLFRELDPGPTHTNLTATLPLRLFCWATGGMIVLFAISWYIETYCVLYKDIHS